MLKIEAKPQDDCQLQLTVQVEDERVQGALRAAARRMSQKLNVPGFRKGKAPFEVIRRQVGEAALYDEALEALGQEVYKEALNESDVDPYAPGALDNVSLNPMVLTYTVPLKPEVDLGDYRSVRLDHTPPQVADEALEEALDQLREHQALIEPADRPARTGDIVVIDVRGEVLPIPEVEASEAPSEEATAERFLLDDKGVSLLLDPKTDWPLPGFAEKLEGISAGESREFDMTFPEDYRNEELRGKTAHFAVQCAEVKSRLVPEWSDELAQSMGDYASLLDLRVKVRQELQKRAEAEADAEYARQVMDRVVEGATVRHPPVLLEGELDDMLDDLDRRLREQNITLEDYLKIQSKTRDALRSELEPRARERLKRALVLGRVVEVEKVRVAEQDVDERIGSLSSVWGEQAAAVKDILSSDRSRRSIGMDLLTDRAVRRLASIARGESPPIENETPAEAEAEPRPETQEPVAEGESPSPSVS